MEDLNNDSMEHMSLEGTDEEDDPNLDELMDEFNNVHFMSGPIYKERHRSLALMKLNEDELQSIYHVTESHCPSFRLRASVLYERSMQDKSCNVMPMIRDNFSFDCQTGDVGSKVNNMLEKLEEMPKEWTLIQLTPTFNLKQTLELTEKKLYTNPLHITVFNCGQISQKPVMVSVGAPKDHMGNSIEVMQEIKNIRTEIKSGSLKFNALNSRKIKESYGDFRMRLNDSMKEITRVVQGKWLQEWKVLLIGKYVDEGVEEEITATLNKILMELGLDKKISQRSVLLLRYLAKGQSYLDEPSLKNAICYTLPDCSLEEHLDLIKAMRKSFSSSALNCQKRHPVMLIVEETIDSVPWEMIDVLIDQPVSRMQSFHFAYALYKEHESDIVDGWKVQDNSDNGAYILNPTLDLVRMENRLTTFFEYWTPSWKSIIGKKPTSDEYLDLVNSSSVFCYNGHGDGFQYIDGNKLAKLRINAVVLLFGCGSVQLQNIGPQCEPFGSHQSYITACSPCVIGMLWTVTDTDTDLLATNLISQWIPSKAPINWKNLEKKPWESGETKIPITKLNCINSAPQKHQPELLTALLKAKRTTRQYLTRAACIARGLPVKLSVKPCSSPNTN